MRPTSGSLSEENGDLSASSFRNSEHKKRDFNAERRQTGLRWRKEGGRPRFQWRGGGALGQTKRALNTAEGVDLCKSAKLSWNKSTKAEEVAFLRCSCLTWEGLEYFFCPIEEIKSANRTHRAMAI